MRIHTAVSLYVLFFSLFFNLSVEKYLCLFLAIAMVLVSEMFNSSIEGLLDVYSREYSSIAKVSKDIAAGAVLTSAGFAVIIGVILFSDFNSYIRVWSFFAFRPIYAVLFLISLFLSVVYVYRGPVEMKNRARKYLKKLRKS